METSKLRIIDIPRRVWKEGSEWKPLAFDDAGSVICPLCARDDQFELLKRLGAIRRFYCFAGHFLEAAKPAAAQTARAVCETSVG